MRNEPYASIDSTGKWNLFCPHEPTRDIWVAPAPKSNGTIVLCDECLKAILDMLAQVGDIENG